MESQHGAVQLTGEAADDKKRRMVKDGCNPGNSTVARSLDEEGKKIAGNWPSIHRELVELDERFMSQAAEALEKTGGKEKKPC